MVKLQPSVYDVIEAGVYDAEIDSVTGEDANPRFEDSRPQLKFIFNVLDPDMDDAKVFAWTGQTYGPKSKLRPWLKVLLPSFDPDGDALDTDDLVGKRCKIVVTVKAGEDGRERNRVGDVLPAEGRRRGAVSSDTALAGGREPVPTVAQRKAAAATAPTLDPDDVPF